MAEQASGWLRYAVEYQSTYGGVAHGTRVPGECRLARDYWPGIPRVSGGREASDEP
jgi:hypothetical protein